MIPHRLFIGTIGEGVFRSLDGGVTFRRACDGMFVECDVRALVVDPRDPARMLLGSELGIFVTHDGAENWARLPAPLHHEEVWALCVPPERPDLIVAGVRPARLIRSEDNGATWSEARANIQKDCPRILHTRVTSLASRSGNPDTIWAGIEIDGLYCSRDAGKSWAATGTGLSSRDIHSIVAVPNSAGLVLLASTNNDVNISRDEGDTWQPLQLGTSTRWPYFRGMTQRSGTPNVVLLGAGDFPPGSVGGILRSEDGGAHWQEARLPAVANSTIWTFAVHPADADMIYAASVSGQVYRSNDAGKTWDKLPREFGEVRALAWTPV